MIANLGWRETVVFFGVPAVVIALAILFLVKESGDDQAAAVAHGTVREAFSKILRDRDHRWIYLASVLGGGGRGLGVVNLFALLYLTRVLQLPSETSDGMYNALIVFSVPMPLIAGWLSDRIGRKPVIIGVYVGGAIGFVIFLAVGSSLAGLWAGIIVMGLFSFAESPQLQALLADIAPAGIRDASFALYFTLAFGFGSLWTAIYGLIIGAAGEPIGLPIVFWLMAGSFVAAALAVLPVSAGRRRG
jgi:MFS family permease